MGAINLQNRSLSIISISTILAASIVLVEFVSFGIAQAQGSNNNTNNSTSSSLYKQGHAKGVADAKSIQITTPPTGTMSADSVDCDSEIDPHMSNNDYCLGYQLGYAGTYNNKVAGSK